MLLACVVAPDRHKQSSEVDFTMYRCAGLER